LEAYVKVCESQGVYLDNWRRGDLCGITCPPGKEFRECGFGASPSCGENSGK
jgi:hypothetical protein